MNIFIVGMRMSGIDWPVEALRAAICSMIVAIQLKLRQESCMKIRIRYKFERDNSGEGEVN